MKDDKFNFWIPIDIDKIEKAGTKDDDKRYDNMVIEGEASDNSTDTDDENMEPNGFILDRFNQSGLINYEHFTDKSPINWFGDVLDSWVKDNILFVKGKLWKKSQLARDFWDTLHIMKESGSTRRPGWSIEGKKIKVDPNNPKRVIKALLTHISLTFSPKNYNSWAAISKGNYSESYIEPEFDETANGGAEYLLDITKPDGTRITIDKEFNTKIIGKAMTAGDTTGMGLVGQETSGAALKKESFGKKKLKILQPNFIKSVIEISKNKDKFSKEQFAKISKHVQKALMN